MNFSKLMNLDSKKFQIQPLLIKVTVLKFIITGFQKTKNTIKNKTKFKSISNAA